MPPGFAYPEWAQLWRPLGQILGLPTTMTLFPLIAVLITAATQVVYKTPIWDPVALTGKFDNPFVVVFALFTLAVGHAVGQCGSQCREPLLRLLKTWPRGGSASEPEA